MLSERQSHPDNGAALGLTVSYDYDQQGSLRFTRRNAGRGEIVVEQRYDRAVSRIKCNTFSELGHLLGHHFFRRKPPESLTRSAVEQPGNVVEVGLAHL